MAAKRTSPMDEGGAANVVALPARATSPGRSGDRNAAPRGAEDGELLARWGTQQGATVENALFIAPHSVTLDSRGDIYVGEVAWTSYNRHIDRGPNVLRKFIRK